MNSLFSALRDRWEERGSSREQLGWQCHHQRGDNGAGGTDGEVPGNYRAQQRSRECFPAGNRSQTLAAAARPVARWLPRPFQPPGTVFSSRGNDTADVAARLFPAHCRAVHHYFIPRGRGFVTFQGSMIRTRFKIKKKKKKGDVEKGRDFCIPARSWQTSSKRAGGERFPLCPGRGHGRITEPSPALFALGTIGNGGTRMAPPDHDKLNPGGSGAATKRGSRRCSRGQPTLIDPQLLRLLKGRTCSFIQRLLFPLAKVPLAAASSSGRDLCHHRWDRRSWARIPLFPPGHLRPC